MAMGIGGKSRTTLAEINVTPLVDVMLVLLIIFMITAPMLQHELDVNLPVATGTPQVNTEDRVVLTVNKQGNIYLDQTAYTLDTLRPKLQALYQTRRNKDLFLRADADVPYGKVVQVMDEVKKAGILKLGMITQPPAEKR
jgi:biopolymer transport protein TolR